LFPLKKSIHGSTPTHILQIMELDLVEINKLSPRGLWQLASIRALIATLLVAMKSGNRGRYAAMYAHMLVQQSESLRAKIRANLNMRIKAWILQCPERIAYVRAVIGEAAIRQWRKNRLLDYALSKYFNDWKRKFSNGFTRSNQKQILPFTRLQNRRAYNWKPFALTKIFNVEGFLYGRVKSSPDPDIAEMRAAYYKLWGTDIRDGIKNAQPRGQRSFKPVEFTPCELVPEAATGTPDDEECALEDTGGTLSLPPPKSLLEQEQSPPKNPVPETSREPPN